MTAIPSPAAPAAAGPRPGDWHDQALCAQTDPEIFHPEVGRSALEAKRICAACPVQPECRAYAIGRPELLGVWGGLTARQRRRLRQTAA